MVCCSDVSIVWLTNYDLFFIPLIIYDDTSSENDLLWLHKSSLPIFSDKSDRHL